MATFTFKALGKSGIESGEIDAADRSSALKNLERRGLQPVKVDLLSEGTLKRDKPTAKAAPVVVESPPEEGLKLKRAELILFTEELADMINAGLQLEPALRSMENRQEVGNLKLVSQKVRQMVRDGNSFSISLRRSSPSFGPLYCSLASAGEASGALGTILSRQAYYLKTLQELQNRIILAMIYPAFLITVGLGVAVIFVTKLIPQLITLIEKTPGGKVPLGVKLLMGIATFFKSYGLILLLLIIAALFLFKAWKSQAENRPIWDRVKLKIPIIGRVVESRFYVQFLETMSNLVANGLPLLKALELSRDATGNLFLRSKLNEVIQLVGDGRSLSSSLIRVGVFPAVLIDMVSVGEQTGKLEHSLARAAERYDKELNHSISRITALIMPTVLITLAVLVGTMAYLMITAIFGTIKNMGG